MSMKIKHCSSINLLAISALFFFYVIVVANHLFAATADEFISSEPSVSFANSVTIHLKKISNKSDLVSLGLPAPNGIIINLSKIGVYRHNSNESLSGVQLQSMMHDYDINGTARGIKSVLIQFPATNINSDYLDIDIYWDRPPKIAYGHKIVDPSQTMVPSPEVIQTRERSITANFFSTSLIDGPPTSRVLFTGSEPAILAIYPEGYVATTDILNNVMSRSELMANKNLSGLQFISENLTKFSSGAIYDEGYDVESAAVIDPVTNYEGWLYDRCATFLISYAHNTDERFYRHALRACSYYSSMINEEGYFTGKATDPKTYKPLPAGTSGASYDIKYSHTRGLYAYYAITGDERARKAVINIAKLWLKEPLFTAPYRKGNLRGSNKLWTERLLGTSMEAMIYGYLLTGDREFFTAFKDLFNTAYSHITTADQAKLDDITKTHLPPQNCFIHNAAQAGEGGKTTDPWCSGWMTELLIDPLLRYYKISSDKRINEIFILLTRQLRDVGSTYFRGNPLDDAFMKPKIAFKSSDTENPRILMPIYGSGVDFEGKRKSFVNWDDFEHCTDATAMTAAGIWSLKKMNTIGERIGPFPSELDSFIALHNEFAFCAQWAFNYHSRKSRNPAYWTSKKLESGYSKGEKKAQNAFIIKNKIGFPVHEASPQRKLSWWFNTSMLQFSLLKDAGISVPFARGGHIQP